MTQIDMARLWRQDRRGHVIDLDRPQLSCFSTRRVNIRPCYPLIRVNNDYAYFVHIKTPKTNKYVILVPQRAPDKLLTSIANTFIWQRGKFGKYIHKKYITFLCFRAKSDWFDMNIVRLAWLVRRLIDTRNRKQILAMIIILRLVI